METKAEMLKRMRASNFKTNNGRVLAAINILRHHYAQLKDVRYALRDIDECDFLDCINFLHEAKYIKLRTIDGRVPTSIEDTDYTEVESKLSEKGIRLMGGELSDAMIEV